MITIREWNDHYETNESRKLKRLLWVKIPNQHDSLPFRTIAGHKRGAEIFAAWVLMVQVSSKQDKENRGKIPMSPEELGLVTGFPVEIFKLAIEVLKSPKIGWIDHNPDNFPSSPETSGNSPANLSVELGMLGITKQEGNYVADATDSLRLQFDEARKLYPGSKRGLDTEFATFRKHKDWREVLPLLIPAIKEGQAHRDWLESCQKTNRKIFIANWKNFQTWLNGRFWEEQFPREVFT